MDAATYHWLCAIRAQHENSGKIFQILLAITFCRLGFQVRNYLSQGVDIDVWNHSKFGNFSIEVKTTSQNTVQLQEKDVRDWQKKIEEGYEIVFAVLPIKRLSNWIIARAKGIQVGKIPILRLQARAIAELQDAVNQEFPQVVDTYAPEIIQQPSESVLDYLNQCLSKQKGKIEEL